RVVGVDQYDGASARADLAVHIEQVRLPAVVFVEVVRIQVNPKLRENCGIKRVVRAGRQDVFARIHQGGKTDIHRFADARSDEHVLDVADAFAFGLGADGV